MPSAVEAAQVLASQYQALGIVWISSDATGSALWAYDAETQQVVTRSIGKPPPFEPAAAAAAALTVKSLFRASTVAPVEERLGAEVIRETPRFDTPTATQAVALPANASSSSASARPTLEHQAPADRPPWFALELGAGVRFLNAGVDTRIAAGAALRLTARTSLLVETRVGPGLGVEQPLFSGRFVDITVPLWARYSVPLSPSLALAPQAGMAVDVSWLSGLARGVQDSVSKVRADGLVNLGVLFEFMATASLRFALEGMMSYRLRYQRYLVNGESVFALAPFEVSSGLRVSGGIL
jgi:hypothetical protein